MCAVSEANSAAGVRIRNTTFVFLLSPLETRYASHIPSTALLKHPLCDKIRARRCSSRWRSWPWPGVFAGCSPGFPFKAGAE